MKIERVVLTMAVRDPNTEWLRVQRYRAMTPQRRLALAQELIHTGRLTVEKAIRNYLDSWARVLDVSDLLIEVRRRASLPPAAG